MEYETFLQRKRLVVADSGQRVSSEAIHPRLFPFQRDLVQWGLRKGRAAIFADTGLGKTLMQLEWARLLGQNTLIIAPLGVARQTSREAEKLNLLVPYVRHPDEVRTPISITNYEMAAHFDADSFGAVILDECLAAGSLIDTPCGPVPIQSLGPGDRIYSAWGLDEIVAVRQRHQFWAVRLKFADGNEVVCSLRHPFFSMQGWAYASMLKRGDYVYGQREAMRVVWDGAHSENESVLRNILLSEMAHEPTRNTGESAFTGSSEEEGREETTLATFWESQSEGRTRTHSRPESLSTARSPSENIGQPEEHSSPAHHTRWEWHWPDRNRAHPHGTAWRGLVLRVPDFVRAEAQRLSYLLQNGFGQSVMHGCRGSGWFQSWFSASTGPEENRGRWGARVESVEIYKSGSSQFRKLSGGQNSICMYDLEIKRHPSFSVSGLLVHNSSILKAVDGRTRSKLTAMFRRTPYKLCCTATPAPNDIAELANHAEFLGIMTRQEMLSAFFVHDSAVGASGGWRLKGHAEEPFYRWLASWGISMRFPSELGYSDDGYHLPPLVIEPLWVPGISGGGLFGVHLDGIGGRIKARRSSLGARVQAALELVCGDSEQWILWCGLNDEGRALAKELPAVLMEGCQQPEEKIAALQAFQDGVVRVLITKSRMAGLGLNLQRCHNMAFVGLSDSWESFYQSIRRCYRFGQSEPVTVRVILSEGERAVWDNVMRKQAEADDMRARLIEHVRGFEELEVREVTETSGVYLEDSASSENYRLLLGDACERLKELPDESIDLSIFSPPFATLYVYSPSERDLANSKSRSEFFEHFGYAIKGLLRVTKPGRNCCVHVMQLTSTKSYNGVIGLVDFRGDVIRAFQAKDWIYHGEICIDKDPQVEAVRTKAKGLLFVQLHKDASWLRQALADYILIFRKPGQNGVPIQPDLTNEDWIEWARPVWYGIRQTNTLNVAAARESEDERHMCPLQLDTIERCVRLWSNPGETILSPFAGVGSEGYVAIRNGRRFIGIELKKSYYDVALRNLESAKASEQFTFALEAESPIGGSVCA